MPLPPQSSLEDVLVRIRTSYTNPSIGSIQQVVLKDGPKTFRIATLLEILDPKTGALHHHSLRIDSIDRRKAGWFSHPDKSIRLDGNDPNEIDRLFAFLTAHVRGDLAARVGDQRIISSRDYKQLEDLLRALPELASSDKLALVRTILAQVEPSASLVQEFTAAFQAGDPSTVRNIATAARGVIYRRAFEELRLMVDEGESREIVFQQHLQRHPWLFGSEYSELLDRRAWVRDDNVDFMLRRTVDSYLEIVEIKTPFSEDLFVHDVSHDTYHPSSRLSKALGQIISYVEEVDRCRDMIRSKDDEDTLKIRARVVLGRDGNAAQQAALRNLNGHLHRIEVITFDQLLRIGARVLALFEPDDPGPALEVDDVPF